jgi:hypothetical protein
MKVYTRRLAGENRLGEPHTEISGLIVGPEDTLVSPALHAAAHEAEMAAAHLYREGRRFLISPQTREEVRIASDAYLQTSHAYRAVAFETADLDGNVEFWQGGIWEPALILEGISRGIHTLAERKQAAGNAGEIVMPHIVYIDADQPHLGPAEDFAHRLALNGVPNPNGTWLPQQHPEYLDPAGGRTL